ncbi:hypothetical protein [Rubritalea marina]|uniref:hypothetical protein n=1 Tax=Rubritalea marina TaxID=361055 RepID=UPI0003612699|nr:hypothetical protein [Rubritalea marina]
MDPADGIERRKLELCHQIDEARQSMVGSLILLDEQVKEKRSMVDKCAQFPKKIGDFFSQGPMQKAIVAAAGGLALSTVMRSKKHAKAKQPSGKPSSSILKSLVLILLKPMIQRILLEKSRVWLAKYMEKQHAQPSPRMRG